MDSLRGRLLVAGPTLLDPNFRRTVVLVCEHSEEGALGLIVNRRTPLAVGDAVPELADVLGPGARLWSGGPVQPASIVLLADLDAPPDEALMVLGSVGLVLQGADLADLPLGERGARAYLGYAGWGPGQPESELERGAWIGGRAHTEPVRARKSSSGGRPGSASSTSPPRRGRRPASSGTLRRS